MIRIYIWNIVFFFFIKIPDYNRDVHNFKLHYLLFVVRQRSMTYRSDTPQGLPWLSLSWTNADLIFSHPSILLSWLSQQP